jgi:cytochrome c553
MRWFRIGGLALAAAALAACQPRPTADGPTFEGDADAGKVVAQRVCAACHGLDGNATAPNIPKLAGQYPEYLQKQLLAFQDGPDGHPRRVNATMGPIAATLSTTDIANVAAYYAGLAETPASARDNRRLALGQTVFTEGDPDHDLPACISCHRPQGGGIRPDFPRIGGQNPDYVENELDHWEETRGHKGKLMSLIVPHLQPDERQAVADYIAQLRPSESGR